MTIQVAEGDKQESAAPFIGSDSEGALMAAGSIVASQKPWASYASPPQPMTSVDSSLVRATLRAAIERGIAWEPLAESSGIEADAVWNPASRVSLECFARLQSETQRAMGDEAMGIGLRPLKPGTWSTMCRLVIHAASLGEAMRQMCDFYNLFDWGYVYHLRINDDIAEFRVEAVDQGALRQDRACEISLESYYRFACWLVRHHIPLVSVNFRHLPPEHALEYKRMFGSPLVQFNMPAVELSFPRHCMSEPIRQNEISLAHFLEDRWLSLLTADHQASWTTRVHQMIGPDYTNTASFAAVANHFKMHPQTLRRRLADEGATFSTVKDDARRGVAMHYIAQCTLSIEEVAYRCGFSECSTFIRAFKRWTELTPSAYRSKLESNRCHSIEGG